MSSVPVPKYSSNSRHLSVFLMLVSGLMQHDCNVEIISHAVILPGGGWLAAPDNPDAPFNDDTLSALEKNMWEYAMAVEKVCRWLAGNICTPWENNTCTFINEEYTFLS